MTDTPALTPDERVSRILGEAMRCELSSWEYFEFLPNIRRYRLLSSRQEEILRKIEKRILGDDHE